MLLLSEPALGPELCRVAVHVRVIVPGIRSNGQHVLGGNTEPSPVTAAHRNIARDVAVREIRNVQPQCFLHARVSVRQRVFVERKVAVRIRGIAERGSANFGLDVAPDALVTDDVAEGPPGHRQGVGLRRPEERNHELCFLAVREGLHLILGDRRESIVQDRAAAGIMVVPIGDGALEHIHDLGGRLLHFLKHTRWHTAGHLRDELVKLVEPVRCVGARLGTEGRLAEHGLVDWPERGVRDLHEILAALLRQGVENSLDPSADLVDDGNNSLRPNCAAD
mmetsp:Transcript_8899/g.28475  ORF Transcript_8899/g.28475 Transcript_8899/m.28475 type:complete len:279 (-) Transcript_8899:582-1418(-)